MYDIMMSFCKKSVHSFLGLTNPMINLDVKADQKVSYKCQSVYGFSLPGGLGLIAVTDEAHRIPNVLESASVRSSPATSPRSSPPLASACTSFSKKDPGGIGFIDDIGGGVDGLMSCTESLGFESSDERRVDDEIELCSRTGSSNKMVGWRRVGERRREVKKFPPPLSSLNHNGQPNFFLRPVRKDGRLELMEVRIDRPEILRAFRQDGRLRLHLVRNEDYDINEEEDQEQEMEGEQEKEEEEKVKEKTEDINLAEEKEQEASFDDDDEWRHQVNGERRCHEVVTGHLHHHHHHPHHNLHVWSQHCVTTR